MSSRTLEDKNSISGISFWKSKFNLFIIFLLLLTLLSWVIVHIRGTQTADINYTYSLLLALIPFAASFKGLVAAKKWGGLSSVIGQSITALSLGVMLWGVGELVWSYYNLVLRVPAPYPSASDAVWVLGYLFWISSVLLLAKLTGVGLILKKRPKLWILVTIVMLLGAGLSYYLLVVVARGGKVLSDPHSLIKVFLDIYYPLMDFAAFNIVVLILSVSVRYIGGKLKIPILLVMLGLALMYLGDTVFVYTTTKGTFYNSDWGDLILLAGVTTLSLALLKYAEVVPKPRGQAVDKE